MAAATDGDGSGQRVQWSRCVELPWQGRGYEREGIDTTRSWQQHVGTSNAKMVCAAGARSSQFFVIWAPATNQAPAGPISPACSCSRSTRASGPPTVWRRRTDGAPHTAASSSSPLAGFDTACAAPAHVQLFFFEGPAHVQLNVPPTLPFVNVSNEQSGL